MPVSVSLRGAPMWREYERTSTTIVDAYLGPVGRFVASSRRAARRAASAAGLDHEVERRRDARGRGRASSRSQTVLSGPAGGIDRRAALRPRARRARCASPSTWAARARSGLVAGGADQYTTEYELECGLPIAMPVIDIKSIGAGGGSVAWVDAGGLPPGRAAERRRRPGPVCYGRGGTQADGHRRERAARPARPRLLPRRAHAARRLGGQRRDGGARRADRARAARAARRRSSRSRTRKWRARSRWSRRARRRSRAASSSWPSAAPGPLHAAEVAASLGMPSGDRARTPGRRLGVGTLLADLRVDRIWTQRSARTT